MPLRRRSRERKRREQTGFQRPCMRPGCLRERGLGLDTCRFCDREIQAASVAAQQEEVTA